MKRIAAILFAALLLLSFGCKAKETAITDGTYTVSVTLAGGTGRASIESPALLTVQDGKMTAWIIWNSGKYDYMVVGGQMLFPEDVDRRHALFAVPVETLDEPLSVIADTTAMSTPHEIEYTITFDASSLNPASRLKPASGLSPAS